MGQSAEELNSQIEATRSRMAGDLDTLQDKVSPSAIVERRKQAVRGQFSAAKDKVMGGGQSASDAVGSASGSVSSTAQDQFAGAPLAAGLAAFGVGVVLASLVPASKMEAEAAHRVVETAKEHGQPLLDDVRSAAQDTMDDVKQSATESVQQVKESAQDSVATVKDEGQSSAETVRNEASSS